MLGAQLRRRRSSATFRPLRKSKHATDGAFENLQPTKTPRAFSAISDDSNFSRLAASISLTAAARNYRILRAQGRTVRKTIDCLVATFCLREGHSLLHADRDFDGFEQLLGPSVVHPQTERAGTPDEDNSV